jgi:hypothetical protein
MPRPRLQACCLLLASALPASVAGQPAAGFDALTPAAEALPAGCALVPVASEWVEGGRVTGGLWAWQRMRSNPWTGQTPQILNEIRTRMFGPLALPDAPPDARTNAQIARTLVEGVSGYAAVYRQEGARVAVYALRSADRRQWTRSSVPERDDGTGQAFSRIGKGKVAALVVGDRGPCFAALERHLQSAVPATDAARASRPAFPPRNLQAAPHRR